MSIFILIDKPLGTIKHSAVHGISTSFNALTTNYDKNFIRQNSHDIDHTRIVSATTFTIYYKAARREIIKTHHQFHPPSYQQFLCSTVFNPYNIQPTNQPSQWPPYCTCYSTWKHNFEIVLINSMIPNAYCVFWHIKLFVIWMMRQWNEPSNIKS